MIVKKILLCLVIFFAFTGLLTGQEPNQKPIDNNPLVTKERLVELEITFFGVGIKRIANLQRFSHGFGLNYQYLNFNIYTNDKGYIDYLANNSFLNQFSFGDLLKMRYIFRMNVVRPCYIDFTPFISISQAQEQYDEADFFISYGIDCEISFLKNNKIGLSSALNINKDFDSKNFYITWLPVKLLIKFRHEKK